MVLSFMLLKDINYLSDVKAKSNLLAKGKARMKRG